MEERNEETRAIGGTAAVTLGIFAFLLLVYPLSGGPVNALFKWAGWNPGIVGFVYAPVFAVCEAIPALDRAYCWYWNLWIA